jgi:hypothetical protein
MGIRFRQVAAVIGLAMAAVLATTGAAAAATPLATTATTTVVTFQVGPETYRIQLIRAADIDHAKALLTGQATNRRIPNGRVVRPYPSVNAPWHWHIDPTSFAWADYTVEICDGLPSSVERNLITSPYFCPWSARVIAVSTYY